MDSLYHFRIHRKEISLQIHQKDTLTYHDSLFSFDYIKDFNASQAILGTGIKQVTVITAEGSGFVIQQYMGIDPSPLKEMMLNQLTEESINYGYSSTKTNFTRKLGSGQEISGLKDVLEYKGAKNIYEVAAIGKKDEGLVIATIRINDNGNPLSEKIINLMWQTLQVRL